MEYLMRFLSILIFVLGCVSEPKEVSSALDSERCGTLTKKQSDFEFQDGVSGKGRLLDAQDKSVQARLDEFVLSKGNLCITADWTAAKEVVLKSSNVIREAQVNQRTEECGTIEEQSDGFYLILSGGETNIENVKKLKSSSPEVHAALESSALEERCIKGDFKVSPLEVTSPDQIRPWVK
jgi:hypothetical protein